MTAAVPELQALPAGLVLDGELVCFNRKGEPHFPLVCLRILMDDRTIPVKLIVFDVLRVDGDDLMGTPLRERRSRLEALGLAGPAWMTPEAFTHGAALFHAVCELGLEGVVAKRLEGLYRPGDRGWVKIKNPAYWRRDLEREAMQRSAERRARRLAHR